MGKAGRKSDVILWNFNKGFWGRTNYRVIRIEIIIHVNIQKGKASQHIYTHKILKYFLLEYIFLVFSITSQIDDIIRNGYSIKVLDKNAFIDVSTRKIFLISDTDWENGFVPVAIMNAHILPSAFCLMNDDLVREAVYNQMCGYVKRSAMARKITKANMPWIFVKSPILELTPLQQQYASSHDLQPEQMGILLGHPIEKYQKTNAKRISLLIEEMQNIWFPKGSFMAQNDVLLSRFVPMKLLSESFFGTGWMRMSMDGIDNFSGMVYNLKSRPFDPLDQNTYLFLMLKGLSHNASIIASEVVFTCIEDIAMRLAYRSRINNILYRNRGPLNGEIGRDGKSCCFK